MVSDLVDNSLFHSQQLLKFAITVSKNYRPVPYHNWDHAFHVAQFMCCILRGASAHFSDVEVCLLINTSLLSHNQHRNWHLYFLVFATTLTTGLSVMAFWCPQITLWHNCTQTLLWRTIISV